MEFLENKKCEICNNEDYKIIYTFKRNKYPHNKFETCSWDGRKSIELNIVECTNCKLVYTKPSFKEEFLQLIYPDDIVEEKDFDANFNNPKYLKLIGLSKSYLKDGTSCDIGSRFGAFPYQLQKETGIKSFGIEYNVSSVEIGKNNGMDIHQGTIKDLLEIMKSKGFSSLSNIFLDDVLEHLVHPKRDLQTFSSLQEPGDKLFLKQMNLNSLGHKLYRKNWYYLQPAAHMFYFTEETISALLNSCGYSVEKIIYPNFYENLVKTTIKEIKIIIKKIFNMHRDWIFNNKIMYLQKRKQSADDMFLVIAKKN